MQYKCSPDCISKNLRPANDLQRHSRSLSLLPFDRPYLRFLLVFHCKYISVLHRFWDINTYLPEIKTSCDLDHAHLGAVCHHRTTRSRWKGPLTIRSVNTGPHSCYWGLQLSSAGTGQTSSVTMSGVARSQGWQTAGHTYTWAMTITGRLSRLISKNKLSRLLCWALNDTAVRTDYGVSSNQAFL